jgi:hypothetical protein
MAFVDAIGVLLIVAVVLYVAWQGYRALRGAHKPVGALWFLGRYGPPANDPRPPRLNREERRRQRASRSRER